VSSPILVLAPLRDGEADAARAPIAALHEPFARVPDTHLARLRVLHPPPRRFRGRTRHYLLLAADHDGPVEPWLAAAARELAPALAHCAFWPGAEDPAEVVRWARRCARASVVGSPHATVEEVGNALALRERVAALRRRPRSSMTQLRRRGGHGDRRRRPAGGIVRGYGQRWLPATCSPACAAAGGAHPGRARRPGDDRGGVGAAPGHHAQRRCRSALVALGLPADPRRLSAGCPQGMAARAEAPGRRPGTWDDELRDLGSWSSYTPERRGAGGRSRPLGARAARRGQWRELAHVQAGLLA
jgi:hypothetical protein